MYLLDEMKAPTFATFGNFIRTELSTSIEDIFNDINAYIFNQEKVDLNHTYIETSILGFGRNHRKVCPINIT